MKINKIILLSISLPILMVGCVTPGYKSPKNIETNGLYRGVSSTSDSTSIAQINWAEYYADPHLQSLLNNSLNSNLNLQIAIKQIDEARAYYRKSRVAFVPNFNLGAQAQYGGTSDFGTQPLPEGSSYASDFSLSASMSWEIDIWGKLRSAKRAAYADMLGQEATKNAVITQLVADVATSYYQLLMLDAQLRTTEKTIKNYTEYLETVKSLKESASVNEVAVQQAYAQLYGAEAYLPTIQNAIFTTENYICLLLGKQGGTVERSDSFELEALSSNMPMGVAAQLLSYRPDVMASEFRLRSSHYRFNVAKASMYPALTLGGSFGSEAMNISNWFDPKSLFWNAVGGLTQPLFNGRALRTQKEVAELQKEESLLSFKNTLLNAGMEVSNALYQSQSLLRRAEKQRLQYESLAKAYDYSQLLLVRGYSTYLDVLVAQTGVFSTELDLYTTYFDVMRQRIELYRALGGGWVTE